VKLGTRTFASLRHRDYRLYFAGNAVSFIGTWMQQIAAYWLVLELTGSPVAVGALALVQTLPVTVFGLLGGAIADRVDLRRLVIACEAVLALVAALLAVLALTGAIEAWQLYVFGLVQGAAIALDFPARHTLVFRIVGRDDLPNAVALRIEVKPKAIAAIRMVFRSSLSPPGAGDTRPPAFDTVSASGLKSSEVHRGSVRRGELPAACSSLERPSLLHRIDASRCVAARVGTCGNWRRSNGSWCGRPCY